MSNSPDVTLSRTTQMVRSTEDQTYQPKTGKISGRKINLIDEISGSINSIQKVVDSAMTHVDNISKEDLTEIKAQKRQLTIIKKNLEINNNLPNDKKTELLDTINDVQFMIDFILKPSVLGAGPDREEAGPQRNVKKESSSSTATSQSKTTKTAKTAKKSPPKTYIYGLNFADLRKTLNSAKISIKNDIIKSRLREADSKFEEDFNKMISDFGLDPKKLNENDVKGLVSLFLIRNDLDDTEEVEKLNELIADKVIPHIIKNLKKDEGINYQKNANTNKREFFAKFGMDESSVSSPKITNLLYIRSKIENKNNVSEGIDSKINKIIVPELHKQFDTICEDLKKIDPQKEVDLSELRKNLNSAMAILNYLSGGVPFTEDNLKLWQELNDKYNSILEIKIKHKNNQTVQDVFAEIIQTYETFIEEGIVMLAREEGEEHSVEDLMQEKYGRSAKDMENIKVANRKNVAKKIITIAERAKNDKLTFDMLTELHQTNNKNIVPISVSQIRTEWGVGFGIREGVDTDEVEAAVGQVMLRANELIYKRDSISDLEWAIELAKLHNDLLDIHPWSDRNGSTSIIFLELMMNIKGNYSPSEIRNKDYYDHLLNVTKSPLAVAVIIYEFMKMTFVPGGYTKHVFDKNFLNKMADLKMKNINDYKKLSSEDIDKLTSICKDQSYTISYLQKSVFLHELLERTYNIENYEYSSEERLLIKNTIKAMAMQTDYKLFDTKKVQEDEKNDYRLVLWYLNFLDGLNLESVNFAIQKKLEEL